MWLDGRVVSVCTYGSVLIEYVAPTGRIMQKRMLETSSDLMDTESAEDVLKLNGAGVEELCQRLGKIFSLEIRYNSVDTAYDHCRSDGRYDQGNARSEGVTLRHFTAWFADTYPLQMSGLCCGSIDFTDIARLSIDTAKVTETDSLQCTQMELDEERALLSVSAYSGSKQDIQASIALKPWTMANWQLLKHMSKSCVPAADQYLRLCAQIQDAYADKTIVTTSDTSTWVPVAPPIPITSIRLRLPMNAQPMLAAKVTEIRESAPAEQRDIVDHILQQVLQETSADHRYRSRQQPDIAQPELYLHHRLRIYHCLRPEQNRWLQTLNTGEQVELCVAVEKPTAARSDSKWVVATVSKLGPPLHDHLSTLPLIQLTLPCSIVLSDDESDESDDESDESDEGDAGAAAPEPELDPSDDQWERLENENGEQFFYNQLTHQTQWRAPRDLHSARIRPKAMDIADCGFESPRTEPGAVMLRSPTATFISCFVNPAVLQGRDLERVRDKCAEIAAQEPQLLVGLSIKFVESSVAELPFALREKVQVCVTSDRPARWVDATIVSLSKQHASVRYFSELTGSMGYWTRGRNRSHNLPRAKEKRVLQRDMRREAPSHSELLAKEAKILSYVESTGKWLLRFSDMDDKRDESIDYGVEMVDLRQHCFVTSALALPVERASVIAPVGTHLLQCLSCCEECPPSRFANEFCYQEYRVTGDSERKRGARHTLTLCKQCFKDYVAREIRTAKLYVKCPCCPRSLQTRELRRLVKPEMYTALLERIAAAEKAHVDADTLALAQSLDLRRCPQCSTIIEKNAGCPSMDCYMCGHHFTWSDAERVQRKIMQPPEGVPKETLIERFPVGWSVARNVNDQEYYYNVVTDERVWDMPAALRVARGWTTHTDDGLVYYYNVLTDESVWDPPTFTNERVIPQ
jgi:hypothetical protein